MKVNICGILHEVIEKEDAFNTGECGLIDHHYSEIIINKNLSKAMYNETLIHEMVHGILVHLGYNELSEDEKFVQSLANGISHGFDIKKVD